MPEYDTVMPTVRAEVFRFAEEMEKKLRKNDHKSQWKSYDRTRADWFLARLKDEVVELEEAIATGIVPDITQEAADVGNFAMMIMDVYARSEADESIQGTGLGHAAGESIHR